MFPKRHNEPDYALLPEREGPVVNRYGKNIQLADRDDTLAGQSLNINGDLAVGEHPNRYKQHGFYFNADNCIACHACESACSEKNDLPPHLAFRAVGYVEGGTYPEYSRINISMACNHCDDPVCLKGCPTRAYTKFAEYGAVLQDPDICFGCGYCTWVCPYNAPQLDPVEGQVQKCNMCVDRLEVGLKPACVSACLAGALDFGVTETKPENREQLEARIPGFPTPEITHPNIRFQQAKSIPNELTRTDAVPLRYVKTDDSGHQPKLRESRKNPEWGFAKLRSREDPLVVFTLISQAVVGVFLMLFLAPLFGLDGLSQAKHPVLFPALLFTLLGAQTFALTLSTMHLGKPHRFYRAFNNLRYSPVSREVAGIAIFYNFLGAYTLLAAMPALFAFLPGSWIETAKSITGYGAVISGVGALYFMYRIYRIPARPFWDHWQTATSFYGNMLALGGISVGLCFGFAEFLQGAQTAELFRIFALPVLAGLVIEGAGLYFHARAMHRHGAEGAASHHIQTTEFGKSYSVRNYLLGFAGLLAITLAIAELTAGISLAIWLLLSIAVIGQALIGRALFYVLVTPTTMPGAFFWRNESFKEHAAKTGIARMPQAGVVQHAH